jgi:alpha-mannosidase
MDAPAPEFVVVPHTHWDREWYEPHDVFRLKLVHMLDGLLDTLEANPGYRFTLDGQAAAVDDYLEMRPSQRSRLEAAVARGQLAVGPWLILLDEFLCDGETIVRNLELGLRASRRVGTELRVGYLPDMFGHAAQTPQVLRGFGIRHAALWRGTPARIDRHAFAWSAPDGSAVRVENLFDGYGNALDVYAVAEGPGGPEALGPAAASYIESVAGWFDGDPVLGMLGTDHYAPPVDLMQTIDAADALSTAARFRVDTIGGYVRRAAPEWDAGDDSALAHLPAVTGELRSHARGNLLPGVFSIRTNLKQAMADAERGLAVAERLDAAFGEDDHRAFFDSAWYKLVESTAHDSVTGCGVDATATEVEGRLGIAASVARGVVLRTMQRLAASVDAGRFVVANPTGFARRAHVEVTVHDPARVELGDGVQLLSPLPEVLGDELLTSAELPKLLRRIHGRELFGQLINAYAFSDDGIRFQVAEAPEGAFDLAAFTAELQARIDADPAGERIWRVQIIAAPRHTALVSVPVGGLATADVDLATAYGSGDVVRTTERMLANRHVAVTVRDDGSVHIAAADGTVLDGALRLVDEGDRGDAYNYGPVDAATAVTTPETVEVHVLEHGPLRGRLLVRRFYAVPDALDASDPDRRSQTRTDLVVDTVLELREDEPMLRVTIDFVNTAADHRLRVLVPTGIPGLGAVPGSSAAGQYAVTERGRTGEGGWGEFPLPTYPAARFVHAGRASVLVTKHSEYEVVGDDTTGEDAIALTLVRAVGMMSVNVHPLRDEPAGGEFAVPGAQYLGTRVRTVFGILPSAGGWTESYTARWSELLRMEPEVARGTRGGPPVVGGVAGAGGPAIPVPLPEAPLLEVEGDVVLESFRLVDAGGEVPPVWEARFVNYRHEPQRLAARAAGIWDRVDLAGHVRERDVDLRSFTIGPARIETFRRRG